MVKHYGYNSTDGSPTKKLSVHLHLFISRTFTNDKTKLDIPAERDNKRILQVEHFCSSPNPKWTTPLKDKKEISCNQTNNQSNYPICHIKTEIKGIRSDQIQISCSVFEKTDPVLLDFKL